MAKPQVKVIAPFDALLPHDIEFSWTGDMAYGNRLVICDGETLATAWDHTETTFALRHTVPAGTLENGKRYAAQVQAIDRDGSPSPISDRLYFFTLKTPTFRFTNVEDGQDVGGSSLTATVGYSQENGERIDGYRFYLYDGMGQQLSESATQSYQDYISYIYRGLESGRTYYIRCAGATANGMALDTGRVRVTARYENPSEYKLIYARCFPQRGYDTYDTNIKIIDCDDPAHGYDYWDGYIDLTDDEVTYGDNFLVPGDFTLMIRGICLYQSAEIFTATNGEDTVRISSYVYDDGSLRYRLTASNGKYEYLIYSNALPRFRQQDIVTLWAQRKGCAYGIRAYVRESNGVRGAMWYGVPEPDSPAKYDAWVDSREAMSARVAMEDFVRDTGESEPAGAPMYAIWIGGR